LVIRSIGSSHSTGCDWLSSRRPNGSEESSFSLREKLTKRWKLRLSAFSYWLLVSRLFGSRLLALFPLRLFVLFRSELIPVDLLVLMRPLVLLLLGGIFGTFLLFFGLLAIFFLLLFTLLGFFRLLLSFLFSVLSRLISLLLGKLLWSGLGVRSSGFGIAAFKRRFVILRCSRFFAILRRFGLLSILGRSGSFAIFRRFWLLSFLWRSGSITILCIRGLLLTANFSSIRLLPILRRSWLLSIIRLLTLLAISRFLSFLGRSRLRRLFTVLRSSRLLAFFGISRLLLPIFGSRRLLALLFRLLVTFDFTIFLGRLLGVILGRFTFQRKCLRSGLFQMFLTRLLLVIAFLILTFFAVFIVIVEFSLFPWARRMGATYLAGRAILTSLFRLSSSVLLKGSSLELLDSRSTADSDQEGSS
jgi:hypothetical protein